MANPIGSQKKLTVNDSRQVGEVVQSPINLETATKGRFIALDGRDCNRADYPELSPLFPVGVFTSTARTLAAAPDAYTIAADGTNFLAPGAAGTNALQASADGITWVTTTGGWAASTAFPSIIVAGTRWIAAPSAGESQPHVINTGGTAANLVVKANWTATTGGTITGLTHGLVYSPTANAGSGRTVLCKDGSLATASGLFYLNDGATAWNACSGGSTMNRTGVVWTGQKFIAVANTGSMYQTSTDGATVVDAFFPFSFSPNSIASDGNGTVVIAVNGNLVTGQNDAGNGFVVSKDHGATWRWVSTSNAALGNLTINYLSYVNGKFIGALNASTPRHLVSVDGVNWTLELISFRGKAAVSNDSMVFSYKSGVYLGIGGATALTATEDMSKFKLPNGGAVNVSSVGFLMGMPLFIKARSN